jgi:hypothetical protein
MQNKINTMCSSKELLKEYKETQRLSLCFLILSLPTYLLEDTERLAMGTNRSVKHKLNPISKAKDKYLRPI